MRPAIFAALLMLTGCMHRRAVPTAVEAPVIEPIENGDVFLWTTPRKLCFPGMDGVPEPSLPCELVDNGKLVI